MDGILPLWKQKGMTSHDCVFKVRKILKTKKVGHTGTLDPAVEGVLPLCIGKATKIASFITDSDKVYEAEVTLGVATETEDQEGEIISTKSVPQGILTTSNVIDALQAFKGPINQTPPMYSAVKVNGKKLYEYAREGKEVDRPERTVTIHDIELLSEGINFANDRATFNIRVRCSKGTYIRTLCVDIGKYLGFPAHMSFLVRNEAGSFLEEDTVTLDELKTSTEEGNEDKHLYPIERGLYNLDIHIPQEDDIKRFLNGQVLPLPAQVPNTNPFQVQTKDGILIAIYQSHPTKEGLMKPVRVFND